MDLVFPTVRLHAREVAAGERAVRLAGEPAPHVRTSVSVPHGQPYSLVGLSARLRVGASATPAQLADEAETASVLWDHIEEFHPYLLAGKFPQVKRGAIDADTLALLRGIRLVGGARDRRLDELLRLLPPIPEWVSIRAPTVNGRCRPEVLAFVAGNAVIVGYENSIQQGATPLGVFTFGPTSPLLRMPVPAGQLITIALVDTSTTTAAAPFAYDVELTAHSS